MPSWLINLQLKMILEIKPTRRRLESDCAFFVEGNYERYKNFKQLQQSEGEPVEDISEYCESYEFKCNEAGCNQQFHSLLKYEEHRFRCHSHQCSVCCKSFSSDRLLSFHISELHDSYFMAMSKRKPSYQCLVLGCDGVFWNNEERRNHLIMVHLFHPSYDFHNPKRYLKSNKKTNLKDVSPKCQDNDIMLVEEVSVVSCDTVREPIPVAQQEKNIHEKSQRGTVGPNRAQRRAEKQRQYDLIHPKPLESVDQNHRPLKAGSQPYITATSALTASSRAIPLISKDDQPCDAILQKDFFCDENAMAVDGADLDSLVQELQSVCLKVPNKISFGRKKRHGQI